MSVSNSEIKAAQDKVGEAVLSKARSPNEPSSGEEPPSGVQGQGTRSAPYDQGNQPEQNATVGTEGTGTEPPSGQQGSGTINEPYDGGNQPVQSNTMSIVDQLSRTKTKEEIQQKKDRKQSLASPPVQTATTPTSSYITTSAATSAPAPVAAPPPMSAPTVTVNGEPEANRGRSQTNTSTTSAAQNAPPSMKDMPKSTRHIERSVSPGQLDDGTHVRCSGEKGESYAPPHGIGRIKGKLFH